MTNPTTTEKVLNVLEDLRQAVSYKIRITKGWTGSERIHALTPAIDYAVEAIKGNERLTDELASLQRERDGFKQDAERYRWLRENLPKGTFGDFDVFDAKSRDAAIDTARGAGKGRGDG